MEDYNYHPGENIKTPGPQPGPGGIPPRALGPQPGRVGYPGERVALTHEVANLKAAHRLTESGPPDHLTLSMAINLGKNEATQLIEELHQLRAALGPVIAYRDFDHPPRGTKPTQSAAAAEVSDLVVSLQAARALIYEITAQLDL